MLAMRSMYGCNTTTDGTAVPRLRVVAVEHAHREWVGAVPYLDLHTSIASVYGMRGYGNGERTATREACV